MNIIKSIFKFIWKMIKLFFKYAPKLLTAMIEQGEKQQRRQK